MKRDRFTFSRKVIFRLICMSAVVAHCTAATGQTTAEPKPATTTAPQKVKQPQAFSPGLKVGQTIPIIELKNQAGKLVSLQTLLQKGPVALVLFRSADW